MAASRARISDVFADGLHLHDITSADPATAKTERVVPTSSLLSEEPARDRHAPLSEITDGTSNTILVGEETGRHGSVRAGDAPIQNISDGTSNTILVGEEAGRDGSVRPGDAPTQNISDGTSNTILLGEETGRDGSVRPGDAPTQNISDGTSNTILLGEEAGREGPVRAGDAPAQSISDGTSNTILVGQETGREGSGGELIDTSGGHHRLVYQSTIEAGDVIQGFGISACEQDAIDLDALLDSLGVPGAERTARVSLVDTGANVELRMDTDGVGGADLTFLTFQGLGSASGLSVGTGGADDIQIGA
jgi:hypothetical protein